MIKEKKNMDMITKAYTDFYSKIIMDKLLSGDFSDDCPRDTNGDGDCGRILCPVCGDKDLLNWSEDFKEAYRKDLIVQHGINSSIDLKDIIIMMFRRNQMVIKELIDSDTKFIGNDGKIF